ncbi:MAG: hypothetical protein QOE35_3466 [Actinomycetota bacterium]|jgi:hypothetical protein
MSLLPLPSRLPARKHLMALGFGLVGVGLMAAAVLTASGLGSPFRARGPESVRTGAVLVNEPGTTTTRPTTSTTAVAGERNRALAPLPAAPATSAPRSSTPTTKPTAPTTTSSLPPLPSTTVPGLLGGLGKAFGG